jgi:hypothetical protein
MGAQPAIQALSWRRTLLASLGAKPPIPDDPDVPAASPGAACIGGGGGRAASPAPGPEPFCTLSVRENMCTVPLSLRGVETRQRY